MSTPETLAEALRDISQGNETVLDIVREMTADNEPIHRLVVSHRQIQPEPPLPPIRAESPPRGHVVTDADGFVEYLTRYGSENVVIFADHASSSMIAVLDETADDGFETVTLQPQPHPLMAPWADLFGRFVPISTWALHVMTHRRAVLEPDARALVLEASQIRIARDLQVSSGFGKTFTRGIVAKIRIEGQGEQSAQIRIPDTITISAPIFVATQPRKLEVDLTFDVQGDQVVLCMTASDYEVAKLEAFEEMLQRIRAATSAGDNDQITITTGCPGWDRWEYLSGSGQ